MQASQYRPQSAAQEPGEVPKRSLPAWDPETAATLVLLAVLLDVLLGTGAFLYRWGPYLLIALVHLHPLAAAVLIKVVLLLLARGRRAWAITGLAVAYILSQPLFLAFAALLHDDWLLSSLLYRQSQVAPLLAVGLLLICWSDAKKLESPRRRRIQRGTAAFGLVLGASAQLPRLAAIPSDVVIFQLVMWLWKLVLLATILGVPLGLVALWRRRRNARR